MLCYAIQAPPSWRVLPRLLGIYAGARLGTYFMSWAVRYAIDYSPIKGKNLPHWSRSETRTRRPPMPAPAASRRSGRLTVRVAVQAPPSTRAPS
mgnify:CR=1 FL=1